MEEKVKARYVLTAPGFRKLQAELDELLSRRTLVADNIRKAKAFGDLSENFEYHEAKREGGFLEGRIMELKTILPTAHVISPEMVDTQRVGIGSVVGVCDLSLDEAWDVWIVGPLEADPGNDQISYESPLGAALLGRSVGDVIETEVPVGIARYEIRTIRTYEV